QAGERIDVVRGQNVKGGARPVAQAVGIGALPVAAQLQRVIAARVGEMLGPVQRLVGLRGKRVTRNAADASEVAHVHYRASRVGRVQGARVDPQVQGVDMVVDFE